MAPAADGDGLITDETLNARSGLPIPTSVGINMYGYGDVCTCVPPGAQLQTTTSVHVEMWTRVHLHARG